MLRSRKNVVRSGSKRGFTLVELLIVIVVIGVLSAMMMLSSTEAVSSARASNIISNMRNIKTAVLSWYTDNLNKIVIDSNKYKIKTDNYGNKTLGEFVNLATGKAEILKYLNSDSSITLKGYENSKQGEYHVSDVGGNKWYVRYNLNGAQSSLKEKLASRAKTLGLSGTDNYTTEPDDSTAVYSNQNYINMLILDLNE